MVVTVTSLTGETFPAAEQLFPQAGAPGWCWCMHFRTSGSDGGRRQREQNHDRLRELARGGPPAPGLLAMQDGAAVGWVGVGPRSGYTRLARSRTLTPLDDAPTWSIVCFAVAKAARGQGVMRTLLDAAVTYARDHGAPMLEAYPRDAGGRVPSAYAYAGTRRLYEEAGFVVAATRRSAPPTLIMRLDLT